MTLRPRKGLLKETAYCNACREADREDRTHPRRPLIVTVLHHAQIRDLEAERNEWKRKHEAWSDLVDVSGGDLWRLAAHFNAIREGLEAERDRLQVEAQKERDWAKESIHERELMQLERDRLREALAELTIHHTVSQPGCTDDNCHQLRGARAALEPADEL